MGCGAVKLRMLKKVMWSLCGQVYSKLADTCQREMSRAVRMALWEYKKGAALTGCADISNTPLPACHLNRFAVHPWPSCAVCAEWDI